MSKLGPEALALMRYLNELARISMVATGPGVSPTLLVAFADQAPIIISDSQSVAEAPVRRQSRRQSPGVLARILNR